MKKKQEVRIELTPKTYMELQDLGCRAVIDLEDIPFREFTLELPPAEGDITMEEVEAYYEKHLDTFGAICKTEKEKKEFLKGIMSSMTSNKIDIDVTVEDNRITISDGDTWTLKLDIKSHKMDLSKVTRLDEVVDNIEMYSSKYEIQKNFGVSQELTESLLSNMYVTLGTIAFIQSDKIDIVRTTSKIDIESNKKKGKKSSKKPVKTYIYKRRYVLDDESIFKTKEAKEDKTIEGTRLYERKTQSWFSSGYWRTSKNGVIHWVSKSIKKAKDTVSEVVREYKITKTE